MNVLDYLDKLRAKPAHVRKQIALISTTVLSLLVFGIWWNAWNADDLVHSAATDRAVSTHSPLSVLFDTAARAKEEVVGAVNDLTNQLHYASGNIESTSGAAAVSASDAPPSGSFGGSAADAPGETISTRPKLLEEDPQNTIAQ